MCLTRMRGAGRDRRGTATRRLKEIQMNHSISNLAPRPDLLTDVLRSKLANPERSLEFDFHASVDAVLSDAGMSAADGGGKLTFYGRDPIVPSPFKFGTMAAIGLAAKSVAAAAVWRDRTGEGQDIHVDVRKALRRFAGFYDQK